MYNVTQNIVNSVYYFLFWRKSIICFTFTSRVYVVRVYELLKSIIMYQGRSEICIKWQLIVTNHVAEGLSFWVNVPPKSGQLAGLYHAYRNKLILSSYFQSWKFWRKLPMTLSIYWIFNLNRMVFYIQFFIG